MSDYVAYFNGRWILNSELRIDLLDRGFLVGDAVFELVRTFNGKSFRMKEHIDRLYYSLKYARINCGLSAQEMIEISEETIRRNEHLRSGVGDFNVWQCVTRGHGYRAWKAEDPTVCIRVAPIDFSYFAHAYKDGLHGVITRTLSYPPEALEPKIKHHSRMNFVLAELEAYDLEAEALPILRDQAGNLTEGSGFNVFLVSNGLIRTPGDRSILQGVSRAMIFDLAREMKIPIAEEDLQPYDLYTADEAFFSSTPFCLVPATQVDRRPIGSGKPGPITERLLAAWSEAVDMDIAEQALRFAGEPEKAMG